MSYRPLIGNIILLLFCMIGFCSGISTGLRLKKRGVKMGFSMCCKIMVSPGFVLKDDCMALQNIDEQEGHDGPELLT